MNPLLYGNKFDQPDSPGRFMSSLYQNSSTSADKDARLQQLTEWLASTGLVEVETGRPASSDASFRRYFRYDVVSGMREKLGATLVAKDAPP
jgi:aminoglycoside/choline kinase family phosphotransferase